MPGFIRFHRQHDGLASMAVCKVSGRRAIWHGACLTMGSASRDSARRQESSEPGFINAGVYIFRQAILDRIPQGPSSLEKDVFPKLIEQGMYAFEAHGIFIDIGTPEDYARAQMLYEKLRQAAVAEPQLQSSKVSNS